MSKAHLTLGLRVMAHPAGMTRRTMYQVLLRAIQRGEEGLGYDLPPSLQVDIIWRNGKQLPWRAGPWEAVMEESNEQRSGWNSVLRRFIRERLEGKRRR